MNKSIVVKCKQNDAVIKLFSNDIFINEVHVKIDGEDSWTIIGFKDLQTAIAKAEKKFNPKNQIICPNCGKKHNEKSFNVFCCTACWNGF